MGIGTRLVEYSVSHPKVITGAMISLTVVLALLALLPTLRPDAFTFLHPVKVDTDPENMLKANEPVREFHDAMKEEMALHDMVVVGVVNEEHEHGVFNPESLSRVYELTQFAKGLQWDENGKKVGVIEVDMIAPSLVDNIEQGDIGEVKFEWLMHTPPKSPEEALAVKEKAERIPFLDGTLLSEDGRAICLYLPITSKDLSHRVYLRLLEKIRTFQGEDQFYITGLPVAEDTFGVEMFKQMAISAPLAMLVIFVLMMLFFRKLLLVVSPMILAIVCVICTMGLLVVTGNTIHIMSSMIPIFIMPIAVLDSIHILSDFFDRYQQTKDRKKTIASVMGSLFVPMLYTSLTSAAGFASLALTPIPPVQTFGLFVALGVMLAWALTVTFVPAFVMFIPAGSLETFGAAHKEDEEKAEIHSGIELWLRRLLDFAGRFTVQRAKVVVGLAVFAAAVSIYGISRIQINDNPTKWFEPDHPIRVADKVLNKHFGGTYMAYLELEPQEREETVQSYLEGFSERLFKTEESVRDQLSSSGQIFQSIETRAQQLHSEVSDPDELLERLSEYAVAQLDSASDDLYYTWDEVVVFLDRERQRKEVFKQPEVLAYIEKLQERLLDTGIVGKSNSLSDIVKTVYRELVSGKPEDFKIPSTARAVAQCLLTFQNSHRPQDLWHFVTPDYRKSVLWVQLKSGDNKDMAEVIQFVRSYMEANPAPYNLRHQWFGLTYINVVWQERMVSGMLHAFLGSFLIVLLMMIVLFRSAFWGTLSMIPLMVTIGVIYGVIGLVGKDYDMPVAVLSSLSLGLAVDYAIHFLSRSREIHERHGPWSDAVRRVFGEPARAIVRNVIAVGVGFLPLLAAPLVPYKTVGFFIASILLVAGGASLLILPALIRLFEHWLFPETKRRNFLCDCTTRVTVGITLIALIGLNLYQFSTLGMTLLTWLSIAGVSGLGLTCLVTSRWCKCERERRIGSERKS